MGKSLNLLMLCAFLSIFPSSDSKSLGESDSEDSSKSAKFLELAEALKYGDDCSWEVEERRRDYLKLIMFGNLTALRQMEDEFIEKEYKLCSASELYVCDKESQKCACGDPGYEWINEVNRSLYILEEKDKCRWNVNTYCVLEGILTSKTTNKSSSNSRCKMGTTCRTTAGEVCTNGKMLRYILKNYDLEVISSPEHLTKELASGKVCSCKEDKMSDKATRNVDDSEDDNAIQDDGKLKRFRRSTFSDQGHFDKLVSIAGPTVSM